MSIEVGKVYKVTHKRKGVFTVQVTKVDAKSEWVEAVMVSGKTQALLSSNVRVQGEPVSLRCEFCMFEEVV